MNATDTVATLDALGRELFPAGEPGAALGVILPGFRYAQGFGVANLAADTPFTAQTAFRICSISKQFVCLLVRQLEREGLIDLDAHPARYVPALAAFPPDLQVRHLCQNRSGLRDYWCAAMLTGAQAESRFTLDDGAALIRSLAEPMFAPGTQYSYSNGNWRVLEWIIEAVTGRTVPALLQERVFSRLGMAATAWGGDTALPLPGDPRGYRRTPAGWEEEITRIVWSGDAGMVSTLDDLLRWEAALLAADEALLPGAGSLGEAMPHPDGSPGYYAFGVNAWSKDGRRMHWHGGALRGWRMVQMRFPEDSAAIVVMINRTENPSPYALKIAERLGIHTTWDEVAASSAPIPAGVLGVHASANLGLIAEIRERDGKAHLDLGGESVPLLATGDDTLASASGFYRLASTPAGVDIHARQFGWRDTFTRLAPGDDRARLGGKTFGNTALNARIAFAADGESLRIHGPHGASEVYPVRAVARDVVAFDCDRALDELPPGRFALRIGADQRSLEVGCFLTRGFRFERIAP